MASPEFEEMRSLLAAGSFMDGDDVVESRASMDSMLGAIPPDETVRFDEVDVAGRPALWVRPQDAPEGRAVLYLHGGAYRIGSPTAYRGIVSNYAAAVGVPFLVLDYRLAPEHPFPAAVEDAVAAVGWLRESGYGPRQLAIAGDSAGGGLTIATMLSLRDRGEPQPTCAACLSPWADLTLQSDSYRRFADVDPVFGRDAARVGVDDYLAGADPLDPLASPALARSLSGLAPVLIQSSDAEVLTDDSIVLASSLRRDAVPVELDLWEGLTHVFQAGGPAIPESAEALSRMAAFITSYWP